MDMLININQLLITKAFWSSCINFFVDFLGNYGWAIILFTIILKIILSPLDVMQRRASKKQTMMQAKLQPQLAKLQQQYGNDKEKLNQKTNELYQKEMNMKGTCLPMLISMIVTLVVFFTLFNALNAIAESKDSEIFNSLRTTYETSQTYVNTDTDYLATLEGKTTEEIETANYNYIKSEVLKEYDELKDKHGFLWVQNLWKSDTSTSPFVSFDDYKNYYTSNVGEIADEEIFKAEYDEIIEMIKSENRDNNGLFILIILAGLVTLVVQWLTQKSMAKTANVQANSTNKIMLIVMPLLMLIFASTSNALFTLYIITNSIMSFVITKIIDLCLKDKGDNNNDSKKVTKSKTVVEYSRNYFKEN